MNFEMLATLILRGMPPVRWEDTPVPVATYEMPDGNTIQVEWAFNGPADAPVVRDWRIIED